ncbi:MAG: response regulator, partial [Myxococcales bacterium]|nr:response regulator [Myxococcales bacterium]
GLGLSIVKDVVEGVGGELCFESTPGVGTHFILSLPRCAPVVGEEDTEPDLSIDFARARTVLLVDDDELHRRTLTRLLREWGLCTVVTPGAGEALLAAERHVGPIDLALVDVEMPYMNGYELAERLVRLRKLPIVMLSGSETEADLGGGNLRLRKPIEPKRLLRELCRVFGMTHGTGHTREDGSDTSAADLAG